MSEEKTTLNYPRRRILRFICKGVFRTLLRILFRIEVEGIGNFPTNGPLLIVGNHTGAMEVVLLNAFAPRQIEMLSAADMPVEKITDIINFIYGSIPIKRGFYDRGALQKALDVLQQAGMVGLFPEGGVWDVGKQPAQPGISWLSYRSGAPILPIGFNDTAGAMGAGIKLKRPYLKMYIGNILPPASIPPGKAKKVFFKEHAAQIMDIVYKLVPIEEAPHHDEISEESFDLEILIKDNLDNPVELPAALSLNHKADLGKFFLMPHLLDIFLINLGLPVGALKELNTDPPINLLIAGVSSILDYLKTDNPFLLTYRFGVPSGLGMQEGLEELIHILEWSSSGDYQISLRAIRQYFSPIKQKIVIQRNQKSARPWM